MLKTDTRNNQIKMLVIGVDIALIFVSYIVAFQTRFAGAPPETNTEPFLRALPLLMLSFLGYADAFGLLKFYRKSRRSLFSSIIKIVYAHALTTVTIVYFMQGFSFPRLVLVIAPIYQICLLTLWNWAMLTVRDRIEKVMRALVIGSDDMTAGLIGKITGSSLSRKMSISHVFSPEEKVGYLNCLNTGLADEVILCPGLSEDLKMELLLVCMHLRKPVYLVPDVSEIALLNARVLHADDVPLLMLDRLSLSFEQRFFKRLFDLAATFFALPLLLPVLLIVAAAVKLSSPGNVFYSQERVTDGGRVYRIYKFRTMYENAEETTGPVISVADDARVTWVGRFLRRYRIDELPQLLNVLRGEMSLVGPRSERPFFVERYSRDIDGYDIRNNVKAGLTGYAQIYGNYSTSTEYKLKYDIMYIRNYSLLLDIKLILLTFNTILKKGSS